MDESTAMKQRPLNMAETAAKLREKPHQLICCEADSLDMLAGLVRHGFYVVPAKDGHWEIFDTQDSSVKSELHTSSFLEKGQNYVVVVPEPIFAKPMVLDFPRRSETEILWSFMRYGFGGK